MLNLFYSYSHIDEGYREDFEKHLAPLRREGLIKEWHDRKIVPGTKLHDDIDGHLDDADVILLLISADFLASAECRREIDYALRRRRTHHTTVVPTIVRACAWLHETELAELLALPRDGRPVAEWPDRDAAFLNIFNGLRHLLETLPFRLRADYRDELTDTEFISQGKESTRLEEIFVFPSLRRESKEPTDSASNKVSSDKLSELKDVWALAPHCLLRGDDKSGKTVLCRKLFLDRADVGKPVLLLRGADIAHGSQYERTIARAFRNQFTGQYRFWRNQPTKALILDDLNSSCRLQFLDFAREVFDHIVISVSEDDYLLYFHDEAKLASFEVVSFGPLTHAQQERLIINWIKLRNGEKGGATATHGLVDEVEDRVNSIILHSKIVPRYPFYVLSILQTYEAFMPRDLQITAYGHCYHALVTAHLLRTGDTKCGH